MSRITLANSFGMPSIAPHEWQADLHRTRSLLRPGQVLIASVVGTPDNHSKDNPNGLISDFVKCAMLAHEAGPHAIELNFSCPNVYGKEGSIYHDPDIAARICKRLQKELPNAYVLLKIGYLSQSELDAFFKATYRYVAGYTAINTLSAKIISDGQQQEPAFPGANRINAGVSGVAIKNHALDMVRYLGALAVQKKELAILGVGGVSSASDVKLFLEAGANAVQICTAALLNPFVAVEIRKELARERAPMHESRILHKAGLHVPFRDDNTAKVFDTTLKVVERMNVPFDAAYGVVHSNWLASYLKEIDGAGQGERTRRNLPTEQQIEAWLNSALRKNS